MTESQEFFLFKC